VKIDPPAALRRVTYAKNARASRRSKNSAFSDNLSAQPSSETEEMAPTNGMEALLCLQEEDQTLQELAAFKNGELTLHLLQELQLSLLEGKLTRAQLQHLLAAVNQQKAPVKDPALYDLLEDITLRAKIELAKYDSLP
jgi:hypothetical protein